MRLFNFFRRLFRGTEVPPAIPPEEEIAVEIPETDGFEVGSRVMTPKRNIGSIRAIYEDEAWVKTGQGQNVVIKLALLRQAPL